MLWKVKTNLCFHFFADSKKEKKTARFSSIFKYSLHYSETMRRSMNEMIEQGRPDFLGKPIAEEKACHEIWFFSWLIFPEASDNSMRVISNFFKNLRRYLQVQVHHRGWGEPDSWKKNLRPKISWRCPLKMCWPHCSVSRVPEPRIQTRLVT